MTADIARVSNRVMNLGHFLTQAAQRMGSNAALIRGFQNRHFPTVGSEGGQRLCGLVVHGHQKG